MRLGGFLADRGAVWARVHLGRNWSGIVTVKEDHELIRTGPYGYVRHPIYTGLITGLIGTGEVPALVPFTKSRRR